VISKVNVQIKMQKQEKLARYTLSKVKGITSRKFQEILEHYPDIYQYCLNFNIELNSSLNLDSCWVFGEEDYPYNLAQISDPPIALYHKGSLSQIPLKTVAIVGTRRITEYGIKASELVAQCFLENDYCIISGMASGVDTIVHKVCADAGKPSIAVLGTDVNTPYPVSNTNLYKRILTNGLVISENECSEGYNKWVFPRRNRIIAGLAQIVVVIEAPVKSGAIITANYAFDFGREVYAVPGNIFQTNSTGCNLLINQNKAEIFINNKLNADLIAQNTDSLEAQLLRLINTGLTTIDDLFGKVYISRPKLEEALLRMQVNKLVAKDQFDRYIVLSN
jgi:DNA processing protein